MFVPSVGMLKTEGQNWDIYITSDTCSHGSIPWHFFLTIFSSESHKEVLKERYLLEKFCLFSSPEHKVLKVSYCDHPVSGVRRQSSVVRRPSCVVNNSFKAHLLLNYWTNFKIISHKCSPEAPLPKLLKWFRSAEQNGSQS